MTRIEFAPEILDDFDCIVDHLAQFDATDAAQRIAEIIDAIQVLSHSPLIGRKVKAGKRELVLGRGSHGYLALYRYVSEIDTAFMLAIRAQREAEFERRGA